MTTEQVTAIEWCIYKKIPFFVFKDIYHKKILFSAAPSALDENMPEPSRGFFINSFATPHGQNIWIPFELSAKDVLDRRKSLCGYTGADIEPWKESTGHDTYINKVSALIDRLKTAPDEKTVISCTESIYSPEWPLASAIDRMFSISREICTFAFYHPKTGFWLGATPELLLHHDIKKDIYISYSLAGTQTNDDTEWSKKNSREHNIVTRYICDVFDRFEIPHTTEIDDAPYGGFHHKLTRIAGTGGTASFFEILDALSPTPALCGFPKEQALNDIAEIEDHPRRCYGGYVGLRDNDTETAYVTIRCAQNLGSYYTIYGGGGIISLSDAEEEWDEAMMKIDTVAEIMNL